MRGPSVTRRESRASERANVQTRASRQEISPPPFDPSLPRPRARTSITRVHAKGVGGGGCRARRQQGCRGASNRAASQTAARPRAHPRPRGRREEARARVKLLRGKKKERERERRRDSSANVLSAEIKNRPRPSRVKREESRRNRV
jgi:hypothetical protein